MVDLSFSEISERLRNIELPPVDLVVGISRGGIVPASLIAHQLGLDMMVLSINYRDDRNNPRYSTPQLIAPLTPTPLPGTHILLVDDVSVSGKTLNLARTILHDYPVTTFTLKGKADFVLFPEISSCVNWPWKSKDPISTDTTIGTQ